MPNDDRREFSHGVEKSHGFALRNARQKTASTPSIFIRIDGLLAVFI